MVPSPPPEDVPGDAAAAAAPAAADVAALPALSKMKKGELVEECTARGVPADGTVAELRDRLRTARSGGALTAAAAAAVAAVADDETA
jgi:hypothetical protein